MSCNIFYFLPRLRRASVVTPQQHQYPPPEPFSFVALHPQQYTGLYPHLQVCTG